MRKFGEFGESLVIRQTKTIQTFPPQISSRHSPCIELYEFRFKAGIIHCCSIVLLIFNARLDATATPRATIDWHHSRIVYTIYGATHSSTDRPANHLPKSKPQVSEYAIQSSPYIITSSIRRH